jgi:hypothetical protein
MTVRVFAANGTTLLCEFPYFTSLSVLDTINDVGSFQWTWNLNSPGASNLISDTDLQVAVMMDARNGSGFQEVWRGLYEQDNYDPANDKQAQVIAQGRSMLALLSSAIVYPQGGVGNTTTSWSFAGESPGGIMEILLTAAQARGWSPTFAWSFTAGQDSSGAAWTQGFTNAFSAGTDLMSLLTSLAQGGLCDFNMSGTTLNMYNPDTTLATDRSSTVFLRRSREIVTAPQSRDRTQISTVMLAMGDNGLNIEVVAATYGSLGRRETSLQQSGVTSAATLTFFADQALGAVDDQLVSLVPVYAVDTARGGPVPWVSYHAGDYISVDVQGSPVKYRATQIAVQCGPGGPTFVEPTLNDVFYSRELLVEKSLLSLTHGLVSSAGAPGLPAPGPNPTVPGVPAFQPTDIYTAAYYSPATGTTLAQMELQWTTPANTDGTTMIDGANYLVQYKLSTTPLYPIAWTQLQGKPWNTIQGNPWSNPLDTPQNQQWTTVQVDIDSNNLIIQGLICGETYDFQIACTDVSGNTGSFSSVSAFETATDSVAPQAPDAPTVFASMVAVQVFSDLGSSSGGTFNLPQDIDHLEVHYSYDPSFTPAPGVGSATYLGKLIATAGMVNAQIPAVGTFNVTNTSGIYIKLIAVDSSGNTSPASPGSGVTATLIDDSHISSLSVSKLIAGTVTATIILGGTIETAASGARAVMDSAGFHAYNSSGFKVFDVSPSATTIILASGTGGNEFLVDCSGFYPTLELYDITGTKPAFINAVEFGSQTGAGIGINTAQYTSSLDSTTVAQRLWMDGPFGAHLEIIDTSQAQNGGGFHADDTFSYFDFQEHGTSLGQIQIAYDSTNTDSILSFTGYNQNVGPYANSTMFFFTLSPIGSGTTGISVTYGPTMTSTVRPFVNYSCSTTGATGGNINAISTTGFSYTLSGASPAAWALWVWGLRTR